MRKIAAPLPPPTWHRNLLFHCHFITLRNQSIFIILTLLGISFLGSCQPDDAVSRTSVRAMPKVLRVLTWEEYLAPDVLAAFTEETGIPVEYTSIENTEDLIGTLRAYGNRYDVVIFDNSSVARVQRNRLLQPLDHSRLQGIENLEPRFLDTENDPGNQYSLPYLWGTTLVAYRNDRITDPEPSFELLFDEKLKGRVLMLDDMYESLAVPLLMNGHSINTTDHAILREAGDKLAQAVSSQGLRFVSDVQIRSALASGEAWAALCYNGDAAMVAAKHPEVSFFLPKEGMAMWLDVMAISREAGNVDAAYQFISFMLRPEMATSTANELYFFSPNRFAKPATDAEQIAGKPFVVPEDALQKLEFFKKTSPAEVEFMSKLAGEIRELEQLSD